MAREREEEEGEGRKGKEKKKLTGRLHYVRNFHASRNVEQFMIYAH